MGGGECVNRCVCSVSACGVHMCACSLVCSVAASGRLSNSTPGFSAGSCQRASRPAVQHTPQGTQQGGTCRLVQDPRQQNRPEGPNLTQHDSTTPAPSVEAWHPAITSTWVRLLPLPGSAHPLSRATPSRVPPGVLGHLRGLPDRPG